MIAAEIDLSIGSLEALSGSVAAVVIINHGYSIYLGIAAGLAATVLCGRVSGLITWKLKVVSFISTLAMLGIAQGAAFLLTNGQAVAGFGDTYDKIGTFTVRGFPGAAIIAIVVFVVLHLMLTRTRFGLKIYAVGGNAEAAAFAGISPGRVKLYALMISGLCAGIAGIILSSRLDAGNGLFGANDLLQAVAAVVIGGTSLFGGVGNVLGTAIGVLIIQSIYNGHDPAERPGLLAADRRRRDHHRRLGRRPAREGRAAGGAVSDRASEAAASCWRRAGSRSRTAP